MDGKIVLLLALCGGLVACGPSQQEVNLADGELSSYGPCLVHDYGHGLYYVPCGQGRFAQALVKFLAENPTLRITAMSGNGNGGHGRDKGYFLVTETR